MSIRAFLNLLASQFAVLSGVFGDDFDALVTAAEDIPNHPDAFHTYEETLNGEVVPSRTEAFVWAGDHGMEKYLGSGGPLSKAVEALVGEGPTVLYKEKLNYKLAGGGGYRAHQDGYTGLGVSKEPYAFMTQVCMIALDDFTMENGCPEVAPATWRKKEGWLRPLPPEEELGPWVPVLLKKGDVLIYDNYMLHRSGTNATDTNRRALFGIYNAESDGDWHDAYYQNEAKGRRAEGTKSIGGKANGFFTGTGVVMESAKL